MIIGSTSTTPVTTVAKPDLKALRLGPAGPPGPKGDPGSTYFHTQSSPAATWTVPNPTGRADCAVIVRVGGEEVLADVQTSNSTITVTFAEPISGSLVIL